MKQKKGRKATANELRAWQIHIGTRFMRCHRGLRGVLRGVILFVEMETMSNLVWFGHVVVSKVQMLVPKIRCWILSCRHSPHIMWGVSSRLGAIGTYRRRIFGTCRALDWLSPCHEASGIIHRFKSRRMIFVIASINDIAILE
jgi:hypothetical protein